jgi:hypothetical protein
MGGGTRCCRTRGCTGALSSWEAGSGTMGHMAALEPFCVGRQGPVLRDTQQCRSPSHPRRQDPELRALWWCANACLAPS